MISLPILCYEEDFNCDSFSCWEAVGPQGVSTAPLAMLPDPNVSHTTLKTMRVDHLDEDHGVPDTDIWKRTKMNAMQRRARFLFRSEEIKSKENLNVTPSIQSMPFLSSMAKSFGHSVISSKRQTMK